MEIALLALVFVASFSKNLFIPINFKCVHILKNFSVDTCSLGYITKNNSYLANPNYPTVYTTQGQTCTYEATSSNFKDSNKY